MTNVQQSVARQFSSADANGAEFTCERNRLRLNVAREAIAQNEIYQHFTRIPGRIVRCLDYLGISFDHRLVHDRLLTYYLFIAVIDDALDSGNLSVGINVLELFDNLSDGIDEQLSPVALMTLLLKNDAGSDNRRRLSEGLHQLYQEVISERSATSINEYIETRKALGCHTAELSYLWIVRLLRGDTCAVLQLMKQVGKVGCLVDSVIDFNVDSQKGLLNFTPSAWDRFRLLSSAMVEGVYALARYPRLITLFMEAVTDNIRDRFRRRNPDVLAFSTEKEDAVTRAI